MTKKSRTHNFTYPANPAEEVFGVHLSARFRLTGSTFAYTCNFLHCGQYLGDYAAKYNI